MIEVTNMIVLPEPETLSRAKRLNLSEQNNLGKGTTSPTERLVGFAVDEGARDDEQGGLGPSVCRGREDDRLFPPGGLT